MQEILKRLKVRSKVSTGGQLVEAAPFFRSPCSVPFIFKMKGYVSYSLIVDRCTRRWTILWYHYHIYLKPANKLLPCTLFVLDMKEGTWKKKEDRTNWCRGGGMLLKNQLHSGRHERSTVFSLFQYSFTMSCQNWSSLIHFVNVVRRLASIWVEWGQF